MIKSFKSKETDTISVLRIQTTHLYLDLAGRDPGEGGELNRVGLTGLVEHQIAILVQFPKRPAMQSAINNGFFGLLLVTIVAHHNVFAPGQYFTIIRQFNRDSGERQPGCTWLRSRRWIYSK